MPSCWHVSNAKRLSCFPHFTQLTASWSASQPIKIIARRIDLECRVAIPVRIPDAVNACYKLPVTAVPQISATEPIMPSGFAIALIERRLLE